MYHDYFIQNILNYFSNSQLLFFVSIQCLATANINVLDGRRGDCATRHSAALRAVALARARCTRSPLCLFVWQPALHYAAHLYHHEQPHFSIPIYRRLRILRHRHLHSPLLAGHDALPFVALSLCWHVARASSRNILLLRKSFSRVLFYISIKIFILLFLLLPFLCLSLSLSRLVWKIKVNNNHSCTLILEWVSEEELLRIYNWVLQVGMR